MEKRSGIARPAPANPPATTSNTLINNVRNELPSILHTRPESANAAQNGGSIAPASRQLQSLGRLIQQAKNDYSDRRGNEATTNASLEAAASSGSTSAARRRRHTPSGGAASLTSSMDSTGSGGRGAWAGGEADSKADSDSHTPTSRGVVDDAKSERHQKSNSSGSTKSGNTPHAANSSTTTTQKGQNSNNSYSLMGSKNSHSDSSSSVGGGANHSSGSGGGVSMGGAEDPATTALRKILEQEKTARKALEMKV